ncbi:MAG: hypothetical protein LUD19_06255 [Clostridia bacterium]|nr:hypothetical protein [Clostridia bacterium]
MKKLLAIFIVALSALCIVPFAGCDSEETDNNTAGDTTTTTESETGEDSSSVKLTTTNYSDYLVLSADIEDMDITYYETSISTATTKYFFVTCIVSVSVAPKGDYRFDISTLKIHVSPNTTSWSWSNGTLAYVDICPDYYGYGSGSIYFYKQSTTASFSYDSSDITTRITSISGTVTV